MVFIVHGASSLVHDQIKTMAGRIECLHTTSLMNENYYRRENFENFITGAHPGFGKKGWSQLGVWG